jgi:hypothetical protein
MRRPWLCGCENVHKRYLIHVAGHNLGMLMRLLIGAGTPKEAAARGRAFLFVNYRDQPWRSSFSSSTKPAPASSRSPSPPADMITTPTPLTAGKRARSPARSRQLSARPPAGQRAGLLQPRTQELVLHAHRLCGDALRRARASSDCHHAPAARRRSRRARLPQPQLPHRHREPTRQVFDGLALDQPQHPSRLRERLTADRAPIAATAPTATSIPATSPSISCFSRFPSSAATDAGDQTL